MSLHLFTLFRKPRWRHVGNFVFFALVALTFLYLVTIFGVHIRKSTSFRYITLPSPFNESTVTINRLKITFGQQHIGTTSPSTAEEIKKQRRMLVTLPGYSARLGNQMFGHAALLGLARRYGFKPIMTATSLTNHLVRATFHVKTDIVHQAPSAVKRYKSPDDQVFDLPDDITSGGNDVELVGYFQSWRYFADYADIIANEFQFQTHIMSAASQVVGRLMKSLPSDYAAIGSNSSNLPLKIVRVGIHIRRTDMALPIQQKRGYRVASARYVRDAMNYVEKRIVDNAPSPSSVKLVYIVCTDDKLWARAHITSKRFPVLQSDTTFMDSAIDLAILASCDHVITSTGTYSWWAGFLASVYRQREQLQKLSSTLDQRLGNELNRTIITYCADFPPRDTEIGKYFRPEDVYPPWWIGLR